MKTGNEDHEDYPKEIGRCPGIYIEDNLTSLRDLIRVLGDYLKGRENTVRALYRYNKNTNTFSAVISKIKDGSLSFIGLYNSLLTLRMGSTKGLTFEYSEKRHYKKILAGAARGVDYYSFIPDDSIFFFSLKRNDGFGLSSCNLLCSLVNGNKNKTPAEIRASLPEGFKDAYDDALVIKTCDSIDNYLSEEEH